MDFLQRLIGIGQGEMALNYKKGTFRLDVRRNSLLGGTETGCPEKLWMVVWMIPGGVRGQAGRGPGQPDLVGSNHVNSSWLELDDL